MNYQEKLDYLFSKLPMYQRQGVAAYKADIGNIVAASKYLGNPHTQFKSIHIAGTNGKGSTAHMLTSVLKEAGYKVGVYTSPHLKDFRERIKINGEKISENSVIKFVDQHKIAFENISISFFEFTVAMAFDYFAKEKVDIAIIETGLGGRLDSTNIIKPELSIITNIGIDHTNLLGNTIEKIAAEKAGIIKENTPIIIGRKQKETNTIYQPYLDVKWDDSVYSTGSLVSLTGFNPYTVVVKNVGREYKFGSVPRINIFAREKAPLKNFVKGYQQSQYLSSSLLPADSYYAIKDNESENINNITNDEIHNENNDDTHESESDSSESEAIYDSDLQYEDYDYASD